MRISSDLFTYISADSVGWYPHFCKCRYHPCCLQLCKCKYSTPFFLKRWLHLLQSATSAYIHKTFLGCFWSHWLYVFYMHLHPILPSHLLYFLSSCTLGIFSRRKLSVLFPGFTAFLHMLFRCRGDVVFFLRFVILFEQNVFLNLFRQF